MYQLQFINLVYDTTKLTHLEQTNINLFIGNWSNHQLQKSICIRHGDDTSHNQYHILFIDTAHQRINFHLLIMKKSFIFLIMMIHSISSCKRHPNKVLALRDQLFMSA